MQVKKQQLELDKEQQTGSKLGKDYIKAVYCHPGYLTSLIVLLLLHPISFVLFSFVSRHLGNVPCAHAKNACFAVVRWNILFMFVRFSWFMVFFKPLLPY